MTKKLILLLSFLALLIVPVVSFAAPPAWVPQFNNLLAVANALSSIINFIFAMFLGIAVIMFILAGYYFLTNDPTKGRQSVIYGVIGVGVAILSFSVVNIVVALLTGGGN